MTDDLIARLRAFVVERGKIACGSDIVSACNNSALSLSDLRDLLAELEAAREDAARYRWLRMMAKEQLLNPKAAGSECPDMRTYWRIPALICSGPVGGFVDFDAAIDQARGKGVADEA